MRHVPISEFKDHASEWVAAAERGEDVVITRHGKPAARLSGLALGDRERRRSVQAALEGLAEIRIQQRALGMSATIGEMIAWKNEGRR